MTINCKGFLLDLSTPIVMGIVNLTPDSFYDGGSITSNTDLLKRVTQLLEEGASILDIGGYSTRPMASRVELIEEINRVIPAIKLVMKEYPDAIISIDTFRQEVAHAAVSEGASMVNDISAGELDAKMLPWVGASKLPYILMHMQGNPENMQDLPFYENVVNEENFFFSKKINQLKSFGIHDIILDPGFGFGKTLDHNYELLRNLDLIGWSAYPLLVGLSRKSMIYKPLGNEPADALTGTSALHMIALKKGAKILRVHDAKEAGEVIQLYRTIYG